MTKKTICLLLTICGYLTGVTSCKNNDKNAKENIPSKNGSTSIIKLDKEFALENVVYYRLNKATIIVKQTDFENKLRSIWEHYNEGMQGIETEDKDFKRTYTARFKALDSTLQLFKSQKKPNIIHLEHRFFEQFEFRPLMDFEKQIEMGNCAIIDNRNKRHYKVLRKNFSWHYNERNAGAGRKYFLPGEAIFFYETVDSIS